MPAYKDSRQGTWYASFYFENWQGVKQKKLKRGFATKKDTLAWEREFLLQQAADLTMTFEAFVEIYITDKKKRLRENTWSTKEHIIRTKILPYFKEKKLSEIKPRDVIAWQNEMLNYRDKNGKAYSPTYLKTLHGQLSAILNHAVRFYGLKSNAAAIAGCMGSEKHKEMLFWTKEEYLKFAEVMMDKPQSYYAYAPNGKIKKSDVTVAKNYLTEDEMKSMELIVSAYLDLAENRARRHIPMTMEDWAKRLDIYLQADDLEVLKDAGKISAQLAKMHAETEFEKYRVVQDRLYQSDFDRYLETNSIE